VPGEPITVIHFIRHGENAWNREEVFRGRADVPLNERRHAQARTLASQSVAAAAAMTTSSSRHVE